MIPSVPQHDRIRPARRRSSARRTATAALLALAVTAGTAGPAAAAAPPSVQRLAGDDRYATAATIARQAHPTGAGAVVVASGEAFPDALAASALAGSLGAPVLLAREGSAPASTTAAITALDPSLVVVVGGTARLGDATASALAAAAPGAVVRRISGDDRYATAALVAREIPASRIGTVDGRRTALLATGERFPDALAGGPAAASLSLPLLLTTPTALSGAAADALAAGGVQQVVVLGGEAGVGAGVADDLAARGLTVVRLAGDDRQATAAAVADWSVEHAGLSASRVAIARGDDAGGGADALAMGPLAALRKEPLLLAARPDLAGGATVAWLDAHRSVLTAVDVVGSESAVRASVVQTVLNAAAGALGVCEGLADCSRVASVDVDGDGAPDDVAVVGAGDRGAATAVRVRTAGALLSAPVDFRDWVGSPWHGATDIDGVPGEELVIGAYAGAHTLFYDVLTVRDGRLVVLPPPGGTADDQWVVDGAANVALSASCAPGGVVELRTAQRIGTTDAFSGVRTGYRWQGGAWVQTAAPVTTTIPGDPGPEWYGWRCGDLPNGVGA